MENRIQPTRPELPPFEEYTNEIRDIFTTGIMTNNGPKLAEFQNGLKKRMGCDNVELFVNGHAALSLGIASMGLPKGGEVLTSPFTFVSTTNAIVQNDLVPVFCDIDKTYNISIESIERNITEKTCAIITPHIFGIPCHVKEIEEISKRHGLKVIYDGAQAFGTKVDGRDIAVFGDGTMFSLHAIKVFNSIEGGIFCFKNGALGKFLTENRNFGICTDDKLDAEYAGINAKMDEFRAAMGIVNLRYADETIKKRKELAKHYSQRLSDVEGVITYDYEENIDYNYAYYPILIDKDELGVGRDDIHKGLDKRGIGSRILYGRLTCDYRSFASRGYKQDVSFARDITNRCLDLPLYSTLKESDIDRIVDAIKEIAR